jgi:hypothetical protein
MILALYIDPTLKLDSDGLPLSPITGKPLYSEGVGRRYALAGLVGCTGADLLTIRDSNAGNKLAWDAEPFVKHGLRGRDPESTSDGKRGIAWVPLVDDAPATWRTAREFWTFVESHLTGGFSLRGFRDAKYHTDSHGRFSDDWRAGMITSKPAPVTASISPATPNRAARRVVKAADKK